MKHFDLRLLILLVLLMVSSAISVDHSHSHAEQYNLADAPQVYSISGYEIPTSTRWAPVPSISALEQKWYSYAWNKSNHIALAVGKPINVGVTDRFPLALLEQSGSELGLSNHSLTEFARNTVKNFVTVGYQPTLDNIPVYHSYLYLTYNLDNELVMLRSKGYGDILSGGFSLSKEAAIAEAEALVSRNSSLISATQYWMPVEHEFNGMILEPCWEIALETDDPQLMPVVFVNASDGSILGFENRVFYNQVNGDIRGYYLPLYGPDEPELDIFPESFIGISGVGNQYTTRQGFFDFNVQNRQPPYAVTTTLLGKWVRVEWGQGANANFAFNLGQPDEIHLIWNDQFSRLDERNLYVHTNRIRSYWKELDPDFVGMDYAVPAVAEHEAIDNAFWNGRGMYFGSGIERDNFALYADVIYHEYGHGVTGNIYPYNVLPYSGESGAMNEAWSDYFPCSITDEPFLGEGGLIGMNGFIRHIDNNMVYPRDIVGQVHSDSRIISASMWHTREILGKEYCDELFHFARYHHGNTFLGYFVTVLLQDDDDGDISNGTPNDLVLYEQFGKHGIGPGLVPTMFVYGTKMFDDSQFGADGNEDAFWDAGETVRIEFNLKRLGELYPPPAENVTIHCTTDNPYVQFVESEIQVGNMRVDDVNVVNPILINISEDATISYANLYFRVSSSMYDTLLIDTLTVTIGKPEVLIVNGDVDGVDMTSFIKKALQEIDVIVTEFPAPATNNPLNALLSHSKTVIWLTGDATVNRMGNEQMLWLEEFMLSGGNVLMSGQNASLINSNFLEERFGVVSVVDSVRYRAIIGYAQDSMFNEKRFLLLGTPGAMNQYTPSAIEAVGNGVPLLYYSTQNWEINEEEYIAAVINNNELFGFKTVFCGFGIESISGRGNTNTLNDFLFPVLEWFGIVSSREVHEAELPLSFNLLEVYPNPFNPFLFINFEVPKTGRVTITVYDSKGRAVDVLTNEIYNAGKYQASWDANNRFASGVYFAKAEFDGVVQHAKFVLLR